MARLPKNTASTSGAGDIKEITEIDKTSTKTLCDVCSKGLLEEDRCIGCEDCAGWFQGTCIGIQKERVFDVLTNLAGMRWFCSKLERKISDIFKEIKNLDKTIDNLQSMLNTLAESRLKTIENSCASVIEGLDKQATVITQLNGGLLCQCCQRVGNQLQCHKQNMFFDAPRKVKRPILEYASEVWVRYLIRQITSLWVLIFCSHSLYRLLVRLSKTHNFLLLCTALLLLSISLVLLLHSYQCIIMALLAKNLLSILTLWSSVCKHDM